MTAPTAKDLVIDIDEVLLTPRAYETWMAWAATIPERLYAATGRLPDSATIPDEAGMVHEDGSLEVFVDIPGYSRIGMVIPPEEWSWRMRQ